MKTYETTVYHNADVCVVGGGLSGICAALAAARKGVKVVLMQDRPVLGGNSSSEIRLYVRGSIIPEDREAGLIKEFEEENIYRNSEINNCIWDSVLFGKVMEEPNIDLIMNCSCLGADKSGETITAVKGWQLTTYKYHVVKAKIFVDCSGDSVLAPLVGAEYVMRAEGKDVYNESLGLDETSPRFMGMSCLIQARETDHKVNFIPPEWANYYPDAKSLGIPAIKARQTRDDKVDIGGCNFWWISIGGDGDTIGDTEENRNKLLKIAFGVWDYVKNRSGQNLDNWELEWVGFLPGKRESRRYIGDYVLVEDDVKNAVPFPDAVAYGGWPLDIHDYRGMKTNDYMPKFIPVKQAFGIPYRSLYSKNVKNLMFAGRNISASHVAMSSTRVMATCALLGEAVGKALALCKKYDICPRQVNDHMRELQDSILEDGIMLPDKKRDIPELSLSAKLNVSEEQRRILFNGIERPRPNSDDKNYIELEKGAELIFTFNKEREFKNVRLVFDPDYTRESITPYKKVKLFTLRAHMPKNYQPIKVANTIVKDFEIYVDGKSVFKNENNYYSFRKIDLNCRGKEIKIKFNETRGYDKIRLYSADVQ